jgi:hypothetical protein
VTAPARSSGTLGQPSWSAVVRSVAEALPPVVNVVHGDDRVGRALVAAPIDGVAFTGSAAAGHEIARTLHASVPLRPLVAEMGGKKPAIVTESADLDAAAEGIVRSAFGLSGQKCSSCSRAIVARSVHGELLERMVERTRPLTAGDPADSASSLGPVVSSGGGGAVRARRRGGPARRRDRNRRRAPRPPGWFAQPTIVAGGTRTQTRARAHRPTSCGDVSQFGPTPCWNSAARGLLHFGHALDGALDVLVGRARVDRAQPQHDPAAQHRRARQREAVARHRLAIRVWRASSPSRRKHTIASCAPLTTSQPGRARSSASACSASAIPRPTASRNAARPKTRIDSHSFSARAPRVSCTERSRKLTSPVSVSRR